MPNFQVSAHRPLAFSSLVNRNRGIVGDFQERNNALAFAVWFIDRRWFLWFLAVTVLMGLARIFVGVHWPLDILAGALVALTSAVIIRWILPRPDKV